MKQNKDAVSLEERIIQVASLCTEGYSIIEIADITGLQPKSVSNYITRARKNGLFSNCVVHRKVFVKTKKLSDSISKNLIKNFMQKYPIFFEPNQSPCDVDIEKIADIVKLMEYQSDDVNLLIRLYSNNCLYIEAINLLYQYQQNNDLTAEEIKKIEILRHHLRIEEAKHLFGKIPGYLLGDSNELLGEQEEK